VVRKQGGAQRGAGRDAGRERVVSSREREAVDY
jgi:hypothetical protein